MSHIISPVSAISNLNFNPIPTRPINVARVVRKGDTTVFVDTAGRIYSTSIANRVAYSFGCTGRGIEDTFDCCVKLGLVSYEARKEHARRREAADLQRSRTVDTETLRRVAQRLNIPLTAAQLRKLETP